jgi:predicted nucleic acid-binding protein
MSEREQSALRGVQGLLAARGLLPANILEQHKWKAFQRNSSTSTASAAAAVFSKGGRWYSTASVLNQYCSVSVGNSNSNNRRPTAAAAAAAAAAEAQESSRHAMVLQALRTAHEQQVWIPAQHGTRKFLAGNAFLAGVLAGWCSFSARV